MKDIALWDRISNEIKDISANLNRSEYTNNPKLQERVFVNVFLPLFIGEENLYNASFQTWFSFAGTPFTSVDVIDENGKVLFTVPPILDRSVINSVSNTRVSMASVLTTSRQFARIHPNQGKAYLDTELRKRATIKKVPTNMLKYLTTWNAIFKRYGKDEIMEVKETNTPEVVKTSVDDFEPL
jgi:hypothetical protein